MRLLHYLEIRNFKHFGAPQRIELDHPTVLIGPNNCGKTTAIQAIALWSQAVKTWFEAKGRSRPEERTATSLNRLNIVSVPVQRTRYFWHNTAVRTGNREIPILITVGVQRGTGVEPVTMRFRNQGEDLVYCTPDEATLQNPDAIATAAGLSVHLLYPMSGLETEEPILQPGRIDVLLGQGQTAQVLRNLCLLVLQNSREDWQAIVHLMRRLFSVDLSDPTETARGSIDLFYRQPHVREALEVSVAGRGLQQLLLIFAYLYSHRNAVLLIDEPDAHLEILRQRQVYVLLREIAARNESQVVLVTHSEVVLEEALGRNVTLLLGGNADNLAGKPEIRNALTYFGAEHYVRAVQHGYVLYVEGTTDLDILREFAKRLRHSVAERWDKRINAFYVANGHPHPDLDTELERVEGGYGLMPKQHFYALRDLVPGLKGLAILDSDNRARQDSDEGGLRTVYWKRYEAENYFITPEVLRRHVAEHYGTGSAAASEAADEVLDALIRERVFDDRQFPLWKRLDADEAQLPWETGTERLKLSDFAEDFFRRLGQRLGHHMLLRKGELHRLIRLVDPASIAPEVGEKLDLLDDLAESQSVEQKPTIWQHAAGEGVHNHAKLCLEQNVILHGPSKHGKWPDCKKILCKEKDCKKSQIRDLDRFCDEMKEGDLVVLRHGRCKVYGIAEVVGGYKFMDEYNPHVVNGYPPWDIGHARPVCWIWQVPDMKPEKIRLATGGTTHHVHNPKVLCWVARKLKNAGWKGQSSIQS